MAHLWKKESGWIVCTVQENEISQAKKIREERDLIYPNLFEPEESDWRWVGDLGEVIFAKFMDKIGVEYEWIQKEVAGKPDFLLIKSKYYNLNNTSVDIKTVKRRVPYRPDYQAQVHAKHRTEKVDQFFFLSYEYPKNKMWFIGGLEKELYFEKARYYPTGSKVHKYYSTRQNNHNIYNIDAQYLKRTKDWICSMIDACEPT